MESQEILESSTSMDASVSSCNGGMQQYGDYVEESGNLDVDFLNDLDSYWEDIRDRLTVSRMVSDSVIKGIVCAVEQEAAEKIAQKELEIARLKETLHLYHVGIDCNEPMGHLNMFNELKIMKNVLHYTDSDYFLEHERLQDSLHDLIFAAKEQFKKLKKEIEKHKWSEIDKMKGSEINKFKGSGSIRRNGSGSQLWGLSGILEEDMPDKWIDVDRTLDGLRTSLESIYAQTEKGVCLSKSLLSDWQKDREFQAEIEGSVMTNCIRSLQEQFEQRLWDQNSQSCGNESAQCLEKIKELSSLCQELDAISKSLSVPENGQLISHGSLEHRKASSNHVSSASHWEGNGKHDESIIVVPENLDHSQLKHFTKDELFNYFKAEMTKMKRQYELKEHEMTEEYFTLKREYLRERGSSLPVRKDKELDTLKKKIPEVILKLDGILAENEKLPSFSNNGDCLDNLKDRLESLRLENHQLRDSLADKKKEIKCLSSQVSNASDKILERSLAEENLSKMLENLKSALEVSRIQTAISDDLFKFLLKEVVGQMKGFSEELEMEMDIMQGIYKNILKEAAENAEPTSTLKFDDSVIESIIMPGLCEIVLRESFKEAEEKAVTWNLRYINENEARVSFEMAALEKEQALRLNIAEKDKLEQEMLLLRAVIDDKTNLVLEVTGALAQEKEKYELASQKLDNLRVQTMHQKELVSKYDGELQIVKDDLDKALEKIKMDKGEISKLREQLKIVTQKLREAIEEKNVLLSVSQEHQNTLVLVEAREIEYRKQINSTIILVQELSKAVTDFECRTTEDLRVNSLRLEHLSSQLSSLVQDANKLRRTGLMYKQKLEVRCSDLRKAEAEVDLLGDEVDTLLSLLEKIYIALDHYSPILQHYPGIMEVLKLVRRELSGESVKPV
ncbi:WPP domain-associated protein [Ricinus communis]|uniref:WPP domain-associated protein n=1 Tax=Ricinus communis TaxID=3988 RepID=UPI00201A7C6A|nr:WPP domain-associated protein [Ricinus communis]XP_015577267.2 WPP domain-associated protein [Ricinus communis]